MEYVAASMETVVASVDKGSSTSEAYLVFIIFCTTPHFLSCKLYTRKVRKFATKHCLATKQRKSILGVLAVLLGIYAVLVGVLPVLVGVKCED